jgi:hypothetical protein
MPKLIEEYLKLLGAFDDLALSRASPFFSQILYCSLACSFHDSRQEQSQQGARAVARNW